MVSDWLISVGSTHHASCSSKYRNAHGDEVHTPYDSRGVVSVLNLTVSLGRLLQDEDVKQNRRQYSIRFFLRGDIGAHPLGSFLES